MSGLWDKAGNPGEHGKKAVPEKIGHWRSSLVSALFTIKADKVLCIGFAIVLPHLPTIGEGGRSADGESVAESQSNQRSTGQKVRNTVSALRSAFRAVAFATVAAATVAIFGMSAGEASARRAPSSCTIFIHTSVRRSSSSAMAAMTPRLKKLNVFLRDWRRNEPTNMDPRLFDLIWESTRSRRHRLHQTWSAAIARLTPTTCCAPAPRAWPRRASTSGQGHGLLHSRREAVQAPRDRHEVPGRRRRLLSALRFALRAHGCGVCPLLAAHEPRRAGPPLPDGKTLHRPAEGGQMPGFNQAMADNKKRVGKNAILVAGGGSGQVRRRYRKRKNLLASLFGADENEEQIIEADLAESKKAKPSKPVVVTRRSGGDGRRRAREGHQGACSVVRPAFKDAVETPAIETAPCGARHQHRRRGDEGGHDAGTETETDPAFPDLASLAVPVPEMLGERARPGDAEAVENRSARDGGNRSRNRAGARQASRRRCRSPDGRCQYRCRAEPDLTSDEVAALAAEAAHGTPVNDTTDESEGEELADSLDLPPADQARRQRSRWLPSTRRRPRSPVPSRSRLKRRSPRLPARAPARRRPMPLPSNQGRACRAEADDQHAGPLGTVERSGGDLVQARQGAALRLGRHALAALHRLCRGLHAGYRGGRSGPVLGYAVNFLEVRKFDESKTKLIVCRLPIKKARRMRRAFSCR